MAISRTNVDEVTLVNHEFERAVVRHNEYVFELPQRREAGTDG